MIDEELLLEKETIHVFKIERICHTVLLYRIGPIFAITSGSYDGGRWWFTQDPDVVLRTYIQECQHQQAEEKEFIRYWTEMTWEKIEKCT